MEIPRFVTVLCDDSSVVEASGLCQFMGLLGANCQMLDINMVLQGSFTDQSSGLIGHLSNSPLIIAVPNDGAPRSLFAHLVYRLRSNERLNWDGAFLAIVGDREDLSAFLTMDLLGDLTKRFQFGRIPGHSVILRPVQIRELIRQLVAVKEFGSHAWTTLYSIRPTLGGSLR